MNAGLPPPRRPPSIAGVKHFLFPLLLLAIPASAFTQDDTRSKPLKELDGYFPFNVPPTKAEWESRAAAVRQRILVSQGLFPLPTKTPLNAVIHGRLEFDDYTVEKVFFESMPGFFVTGSLYRPRGQSGPFPAVLCPHGHWDDGRFQQRGDAEMKAELESGGERLPEAGRSIFQSLAVQLARMGCIAFLYDMIGYADSQQISHELAHKFAKQRPEANSPEGWGFFSAQAELRLQSVMGLQTWNGVRALDFVESLPEVDRTRIGMTGGSGGGTQTFITAAIDPRVSVAFPAVMVSTAMQGGCTCENASLLRLGTGNVEFAALFAPKPLGMTAANDWTKELATKGFPELQQLYKMLGAPENVQLWSQLQFGHNYNAPTREHIYSWFNQHFRLGLPEPIIERDYPLLTRGQLTVWDAAHPAPTGGLDFEKKLLRWWDEDARQQIAAKPAIAQAAWPVLLGRNYDPQAAIEDGPSSAEATDGDHVAVSVSIRNLFHGEDIRLSLVTPRGGFRDTLVWLDRRDAPLSAENGRWLESFRPVLAAGFRIAGIDLPGQRTPPALQRVVKNPREALCYTLGYNEPLFAQRVHDVLSTIAWLKQKKPGGRVFLAGSGDTGLIAAAASALAGEAVSGLAVEVTNGHPFAKITQWRHPDLLPGAVKYGDLEALIRLSAPRPVIPFQSEAERATALQKLLETTR